MALRSTNSVQLSGLVVSSDLKEKVTGRGEAIFGSLTLQVTEDGTRVPVHFYATPTWSSGKVNPAYDVLMDIFKSDSEQYWLSISGSIDVSYFVPQGQNTTSKSVKVRGAFINPNNEHRFDQKWKIDYLITKVAEHEADSEKGLERRAVVNGFLVDSYRERVNEVSFTAFKPQAIDYLLGLECNLETPYFALTWGRFTEQKKVVLIENAFGENEEQVYKSLVWELTGQKVEPFEMDEENLNTYNTYKKNLESYKESQLSLAETGTTDTLIPF